MPKWKIIQFLIISSILCYVNGKSEQGKSDIVLTPQSNVAKVEKTLFAGSKIFLQITCDSKDPDAEVTIFWTLSEHLCLLDELNSYEQRQYRLALQNETMQIRSEPTTQPCQSGGHIILPEFRFASEASSSIGSAVAPQEEKTTMATVKKNKPTQQIGAKADNPVFTITKDGIYEFALTIEPVKNVDFAAPVHIELPGPQGYLSAIEWPLLPFYGTMCLVYVVYGISWLIVSFLQWRDLLRIQFWIGGVILLGMMEKAVFYAEYQSVNSTGISVQGAELAAEIVSCAKRTLARMLVIIMSLGFGIVKPRLGPMLHRVVGTGALYFILACVESYLRVMRTKNDQRHELLVASIPLAVLDSGICWWIFTSLVQTTRTLRLRRNMVKLSLYRHFTNTLIFSVIASVIFMLYSIRIRRTENCSPGWREIWVDFAFWHVLFSVLLLVIMILWRPTNNNQRYAFTPLLDNPEDEDDDEEEDQFVADAYGVKMRGAHANGPKALSPKATTTEEDDLRWVEENIPSSMSEPALPVLDSDEEIINTKFEVSKMQ
ncbi:transmembrane protein 87A [Episyrphus balteatus]|uniref:transmembrane protein 87A n=1 Tax=Episyrphus balteatus TaxID=286459 RepID=UPI00248522A6|nr:transmembrane protein 87A [Episyrphus balteatus]